MQVDQDQSLLSLLEGELQATQDRQQEAQGRLDTQEERSQLLTQEGSQLDEDQSVSQEMISFLERELEELQGQLGLSPAPSSLESAPEPLAGQF